MKKLFALLLCLCALLAGCGQTAPEPAEPVHPSHEDAVVPVEYKWGNYVNITMELPEGWEWEMTDPNQSDGMVAEGLPGRVGFTFWKTDEPEVRFTFTCWTQGFGMCGTGVDFANVNGIHNLTLAEEKYEDGVYVTIIFNDVPGSYIVEGSVPRDWWEQYRDTVVGMVDSATVADGCITRDEAVDAIRSEYNWPGEACEISGEYDVVEGVWHLNLLDTLPGGEEFAGYARVSNNGEILQLTRDDGSDLPLVWNEANLSGTPRVDEDT